MNELDCSLRNECTRMKVHEIFLLRYMKNKAIDEKWGKVGGIGLLQLCSVSAREAHARL